MTDEDKKVKKKKVKKDEKKKEDEPTAAEPEPEPEAPAPEPEPEPPKPAQGQEEAPPVQEQDEGSAETEVVADRPPVPKKKPKFFIHWDRRKPKFYDYNFDYGSNYYAPVVNYLDSKNLGSTVEIPRRKAFAERGIDSSIVRKSQPDLITQHLMNNVRSSIRGYESFQKDYGYEVDRKYFV